MPRKNISNLWINQAGEILLDKSRIEIADISGQILYSEINYENRISLDISKIGKGIYYLRIILGDKIIVKKIIIQ